MEVKGDEKPTISDIRLQLASCRQKYFAECQELLDKCVTLGIKMFLNIKNESHGLLPSKCSCSFSKDVKATSKNKKRMFSCCVHKDNTIVNRNTSDYVWKLIYIFFYLQICITVRSNYNQNLQDKFMLLFLNNRNEMFAAIYAQKDYAFTNNIFHETDTELDSLNNAVDLMNFLDKHFKS